MKTPGRILLVDDDRHIAFFLKRVLEQAGYVTLGLETAERVHETIEDFQPSAVILDVDMPGRSGIEVCHEIRQDPVHRDLVVVFCTLHSFDASGNHILSAGADWTFPKPISPSSLLRKLRELEVTPA